MIRTKKTSSPPESPAFTGRGASAQTELTVIRYDSGSAEMKRLSGTDELPRIEDDSKISWINVNGLKDLDSIKRLGELYNIHPLTIEDAVHTDQQPKTEIFENYRFISVKTIQQERKWRRAEKGKKIIPFFGKKKEDSGETEELLIDQVSMIIMKNMLISFQEIPGDSFNGVRKRILGGIGDIRKMGTDYLAYTIIDAVVDEYFLTLNHLEEDIEDFEERAATTTDHTFIEEILDTKNYLIQIRRAISPLKDNITAITRREDFFLSDMLTPFLHDLNEHLNHAITTVENHREWLSNIMDVNLSVLTYQMNKVMKVLAIISTIFIPLTFIAGVYGMNFRFMPELEYELGYPAVLCGMGLIALIMIIFFKIRRWF